MVGMNSEKGTLATICILSPLYGIYLVLFSGSLYVLLFRYRRGIGRDRSRPINKTLLTGAIVLFALITTHWVVQIVLLFETFLDPAGHKSLIFSNPLANRKVYAANTLCVSEAIVADMILIYRLYHVWGSSWRVVIAPTMLTAMSIVCALHNGITGIRVAWVVALGSTELVTNILVTSLIAYRIWSIERVVSSSAQSNVMPIISIVVDSAAIFTIHVIMIIVSGVVDPNLGRIFLFVSSPSIGITFSLIIVRVGLGMATEERVITTNEVPQISRWNFRQRMFPRK